MEKSRNNFFPSIPEDSELKIQKSPLQHAKQRNKQYRYLNDVTNEVGQLLIELNLLLILLDLVLVRFQFQIGPLQLFLQSRRTIQLKSETLMAKKTEEGKKIV